MLIPLRSLAALLFALCGAGFASGKVGADIPWTTIEAEAMQTNGTVRGPRYDPYQVETESSEQRCVQLSKAGEHLEFAAPIAADSLVLRYHLPDAPQGGGLDSSLTLLVNGQAVRTLELTSRRMWLYGAYPFSNDPAQGKPRNFYDELRLKDLMILAGATVRLEKKTNDGVPVIVDLVDLELVPAPVAQPAGSLSLLDFGAKQTGRPDVTEALRKAVAAAAAKKGGATVWVPAGDYQLTGDIVVPSGVTIQGAGMWHTTFHGDEQLYGQADRRVRFKLSGEDLHLADFAIFGHLNYRNDQEPNDGVVGAGCTDASVKNVWVEHTKAGVWVYNGTRLTIEGCRFRNLIADGTNFCVGTSYSIVENCTSRGTGDDCYAIWPAPSDQGFDQGAKPGHNVIRRSTGSLTFLANGGAIYGGENNRIEDCLFTDINTGCGILISTTFPTTDEARGVNNNFSGTTVVRNVELVRCGGYDHAWTWRGAMQLCLDRLSISGLQISEVTIRDSFSEGLTVVAPGAAKGQGALADTVVEDLTIEGVGLAEKGRAGVFVRADVSGGLTLKNATVGDVRNESAKFEIRK